MTPIQEKHRFLLENVVDLGTPIGGEESLPDGGSKQVYEFGAIYFHPRIGTAFECHGLILQTYIELGEQSSNLGYPLSDESDDPGIIGGRFNRFEGGTLAFDPAVGVIPQPDENEAVIPQVVVKIVDELPLNLGEGAALSLDELGAAAGLFPGHPVLESVRAILPGLVFRRVFDDLSPPEIQDLIVLAQQNDPTYEPPLFDNFLVIECPEGFDTEALASALNVLAGVVEFAHTEPLPSDPQVVGTGNPFFVGQGYLGTAPQGIGVQAAWARGADGSDTRFVDLEQGWLLTHEDLPPCIPLLAGSNRHSSFAHGAAVLGEIVGIDNNRGIVGIAPRSVARVISYFDRANPAAIGSKKMLARTKSRILKAAKSLRFGDVLLLEVNINASDVRGSFTDGQNHLVPIEADPGVSEAIRLATKLGIIVVEPAGNGGASPANLDDFRDHSGRAVLNRNSPSEFKDSGAIMVGACTSAVPHNPWTRSNFGSRVDCCAWGENILTTGNFARSHRDRRDSYAGNPPPFFGGTSAATAIIAGVCLLIQNLQVLLQPRPGQLGKLGSGTMRRVLSKAQNGTAVTGGIGPMPDMAKIIANEYVNP